MGGFEIRSRRLVEVIRVHVQSTKVQLGTLVWVKVIHCPLKVGYYKLIKRRNDNKKGK